MSFCRYITHMADNPIINLTIQKDVDNFYKKERWSKRRVQPIIEKTNKNATYFSKIDLDKVFFFLTFVDTKIFYRHNFIFIIAHQAEEKSRNKD